MCRWYVRKLKHLPAHATQADEDACPVVEDLIRKLDMERVYRRSEEAKWRETEQLLRRQVQDLESEREQLLHRVQNSVHAEQIAAMQVPAVFVRGFCTGDGLSLVV